MNDESSRVIQARRFAWQAREILNDRAASIGVNAYAVYCALSNYANDHRQAFPGMEVLARKLGISRHTVMRAVKVLREAKLVSVQQQKFGPHQWKTAYVYTLHDVTESDNGSSTGATRDVADQQAHDVQIDVAESDTNETGNETSLERDDPESQTVSKIFSEGSRSMALSDEEKILLNEMLDFCGSSNREAFIALIRSTRIEWIRSAFSDTRQAKALGEIKKNPAAYLTNRVNEWKKRMAHG